MTKQNKIPFVTADFMSERSADNAPLTALLVAMQSNDPRRVKQSGGDLQCTLKQVSSVLTMMSDLLMWERVIEEPRRNQLSDGINLMASVTEICADAMTQVENGWFVEANPKAAAQMYEFKGTASGRTARSAAVESDESEGGGHENE